jgi:hypothetical protein
MQLHFKAIYNDQKADLPKAIQNAIEAHIDGLFAVAYCTCFYARTG